ncbi:hypothetical protein QFC19_006830 [Naganishia cerealis]|uniref:Uncharacterized protein n=1 Tax=Naganishia cerealis TaxID=610337 RepID=A0ACC2VEJ8_9TREE|nr:hypothetical protein QFC19_006830 [Naganishia cerealis]
MPDLIKPNQRNANPLSASEALIAPRLAEAFHISSTLKRHPCALQVVEMGDPLSGTSATQAQVQGSVEPSPSLSTSPVVQGSTVSTPDGTVSELRGESRGRKKNENLPPSRAREVQRAFRARRAAHLAKLEDRILELEAENTELRRLLLLPLPDRGVLGSGPTGRGKSLTEGGVPMSERVKAKRERDRKRAEAAAQARGETLPREKTPDDDTRSKGARAVSASAVSKKRKFSDKGDGQHDEDFGRDGRHVSESFTATPSSSSLGLRSPSITLPTPIAAIAGLPLNANSKQTNRLPSFSSTGGDIGTSRGGSSSSYHNHLPPPPSLDALGNAFGSLSDTQTPIPPLQSASVNSSSPGLLSAALGGRFPHDLHQPFTHHNQDQNPFMNFSAGMTTNPLGTPQDANSSLLNSLLAALPGGNMIPGLSPNSNNTNSDFGNNINNGSNGLPPLPELLSIILKNPELQRRVLQHQMAQKAQQNQISQQHLQSFPSSTTSFPGSSSLFGFDTFDNTNSHQDHLSGYNIAGDNPLNMPRMDPSTLFKDLFNNGRNLQSNQSNNGHGNHNGSSFMPNLMDTLGMSDSHFPASLSLPNNDRPPSSAGNDNLMTFDRLFGSQNTGMSSSNLNNSGRDDFMASASEQSARVDHAPQLSPMVLKNVFQASAAASHQIERPSSVPLPIRSQGPRPVLASRGTATPKDAHEATQSGSADLKGKAKEVPSHLSNAATKGMHPPPMKIPALGQSSSTLKSQPDLLHRLRHCCHLSDQHVSSDPGLLLFASRLCLAVGCDYGGKHNVSDSTSGSGESGVSAMQPDAGNDEDYLKLEAAWQLLRHHLDPPSPQSSSGQGLPGMSSSGDSVNENGKPIDGQNQIATGRLAAEMVLRAVRAKTQSHDEGEDKQQGEKDMSRWIACRRNPGMSVDKAMIVALVNGFGGN